LKYEGCWKISNIRISKEEEMKQFVGIKGNDNIFVKKSREERLLELY
jgi:hypothetical protein